MSRDALYAAHDLLATRRAWRSSAPGRTQYNWNINLAEMARIWKGGCIIRARLLDPVRQAFDARSRSSSTCCSIRRSRRRVDDAQAGWRRTVARAAEARHPACWRTPAALGYFDSYRTARLPQSLTQAQRDAFGAHTYERIDRPGAVHSEWLST